MFCDKGDIAMTNREMIDVAFLAAVLVILVGAFIYVNVFYEEPAEDEEEEDGEDGGEEEDAGSAFCAIADAGRVGAEQPLLRCL